MALHKHLSLSQTSWAAALPLNPLPWNSTGTAQRSRRKSVPIRFSKRFAPNDVTMNPSVFQKKEGTKDEEGNL